MSATINGKTYYRTGEACKLAGISRNTLFRWLRAGVLDIRGRRDRRGWRLFSEDEVNKLKAEVNRITGDD